MLFSHTILYVADVKASMTFYEKAFRLKPKFLHEEGVYGEMETGATALAFASNALGEQTLPKGFLKHSSSGNPQAVEIVFETKDVDGAFSHAVEHGAIPLTEPQDMPWGQRMSRVRDCDGVIVEIASPMA
jgi:uncharacterized glyoxalase superfamily protein PhnB